MIDIKTETERGTQDCMLERERGRERKLSKVSESVTVPVGYETKRCVMVWSSRC